MKRARDFFEEERSSTSDDSGENLMDGMEGDYEAIPELDHYDQNFLDQRDFDRIDVAAQRAAEVTSNLVSSNIIHVRIRPKSTHDI